MNSKPFTTVVETLRDEQLLALKLQVDSEVKARNLQPLEPEAGPHTHDPEGNPIPEPAYPDYPKYPAAREKPEDPNKLAQVSNADLSRIHNSLHESASKASVSKSDGKDLNVIRIAHRQVVQEMITRGMRHIVESPMDYDTIQAMSKDSLERYKKNVELQLSTGTEEGLSRTLTLLSSLLLTETQEII